MQDSWRQFEVGTILHGKTTLKSFLQFAEPVTCREYTLPQDEKINRPERLDSRERQNWAPCRKSQPATCKVNMEWKLELNLWTKTILTRGSEFFHGLNKLVHRTWSTRSTTTASRRPPRRSRKKFTLKNERTCFCKPIQRPKQKPRRSTSGLLIYKNLSDYSSS